MKNPALIEYEYIFEKILGFIQVYIQKCQLACSFHKTRPTQKLMVNPK